MSGPNPPGPDSEGSDDLDQEPGESTAEEECCPGRHRRDRDPLAGLFGARVRAVHRGSLRARRSRTYDYDEYEQDRAGRRGPAAALALGRRSRRDHRRHLPGGVRLAAGDGHGLRQPQRAGWTDLDHVGAARAGRDHHDDPAATAAAPAVIRGTAAAATTAAGDRHGDRATACPRTGAGTAPPPPAPEEPSSAAPAAATTTTRPVLAR